jgi:hypothetical protein
MFCSGWVVATRGPGAGTGGRVGGKGIVDQVGCGNNSGGQGGVGEAKGRGEIRSPAGAARRKPGWVLSRWSCGCEP